jgi:hypothetical protein
MNDEVKSNLALWDSVRMADQSQTQAAKVDGNNLTSINGTYVIQQATKAWGVVGVGWGYDIISERLDDTGPIFKGESDEVLCQGKLHTILVKVWYVSNGKKSETVPHYGHTKYIYKSKWGFTTDYEYAKKSLTDALKKCLSMFGFCADIYMGKFDNPEYREESQHMLAIENASDKQEEIINKKNELLGYIRDSIEQFEMIPNQPALKLVLEKNINKINGICRAIGIPADKSINQLTEACKLRIEAIKENKDGK